MEESTIRPDHSLSTSKLIMLWGFSECALGGFLHALQVPFSGLILAGLAVVIICCLAIYSEHPGRDILYGTLVAMSVKLALSPHTPVTAYVAVAFQGGLGALLTTLPLPRKIAFPLFGALALLESGLQKVFILIILFGQDVWASVEQYFESLLPWSTQHGVSLVLGVVIIYSAIYSIWGAMLGWWAVGLPERIQQIQIVHQLKSISEFPDYKKKTRKLKKGIIVLFILYILVVVFALTQLSSKHLLVVLLRPLVVLILWYLLINPMVKWLIGKLLAKRSNMLSREISQVQQEIPALKRNVLAAYAYATDNYSGIARIKYFISALIYLVCLHDTTQS